MPEFTIARLPIMLSMMLAMCCTANTCRSQAIGPIKPTDGGVIDLPMFRDPALTERKTIVVFDQRYKDLWRAALNRPEFDLRIDAIHAFIDVHERGVTGLDDLQPVFIDLLKNDPHRLVRLSAAMAIISYDFREAASELLKATEDPINVGPDMAAVVDPVLASWDYPPARSVWISRLDLPQSDPARAISAMHGLGIVRAEAAIDELLIVVENPQHSDTLRLAAAEALGWMNDRRIRLSTSHLTSSSRLIDRLLAVRMLNSDNTPEARMQLEILAQYEPIVAAPALGVLNKIDPEIVATKYAHLITSNDPNVRHEVVKALNATPTPSAMIALVTCLSDSDPGVRYLARDTLIRFGESDALSNEVRQACAVALAGHDWRSLEQAALIAGTLQLHESADRLIELMSHDRPESRLAASCALRQLNLEYSLPAIFDRVRALSDQALEAGIRPDEYKDIGAEATQLIMAIGQMRYEPAAELLKRYIPKHSGYDGMARGAALYALGLIYEDNRQPDLSKMFQERLADDTLIDPESGYVRRFAAIGLGRMKAVDGLDTLRDFYLADLQITSIAGASRWAIMQIESGDLPPLKPLVDRPGGYFLEPVGGHGVVVGHEQITYERKMLHGRQDGR